MTARPADSEPTQPPEKGELEDDFKKAGDEVTKPTPPMPTRPVRRGEGDPGGDIAPSPTEPPVPTAELSERDKLFPPASVEAVERHKQEQVRARSTGYGLG